MRFFSNDNRDAEPNDEQDSTVQLRTDNPVDPSQPAVPMQRSGSPWSAAPGDTAPPADRATDIDRPADRGADTDVDRSADRATGVDIDRPADRDTDTDTDVDRLADRGADVDADRPAGRYADVDRRADRAADADNADAELAAQERADGSDELGYAGDHRNGTDAVDLPLDDDHHPDGRDASAPDAVAVATAPVNEENRADAGAAASTTTTYGPDGTVADASRDVVANEEIVSSSEVSPGPAALRDDGGFDDPTAVDPATDRPLDDDGRTGSGPDTAASASDQTWNETRDVSLDETPASDTASGDAASVVSAPVSEAGHPATAPSGDKLPGTVAEPDLSTIFHPDDATSFHDRWRDVQLKFVDSPKDATTEAAGLLDEAVEKLAASLREQKSKLHQVDSDDTETLRVELRGYRDILNRVLGL